MEVAWFTREHSVVVSISRVCSEQQTSHCNQDFMANYRRELRMGGDIRKRGKVEKATEFVERMKKVHEEAGAALKKV